MNGRKTGTIHRSAGELTGLGATGLSWGDGLPTAIRDLERALTSAFHAFDDIDAMSWEHRVRVVDEVTASVTEAALAAAHSGHATWAETVVRLAAERPPAWSSRCTRWEAAITTSLEAIDEVVGDSRRLSA